MSAQPLSNIDIAPATGLNSSSEDTLAQQLPIKINTQKLTVQEQASTDIQNQQAQDSPLSNRSNQDEQVSEKDQKTMNVLKHLALLFSKKTSHCKHKSPDCVTNAVQGFIVNAKWGLMIRAAITLLQLAMGKAKLNKIKFSDQIRFPAFLSLFALIFKLTLCLLRRLRGKEDGLNSFISGFMGGLAILVNNDANTRKMFALYLLCRAYDSGYQVLEGRKIIPNIPNFHMVFVQIVSIQWLYLYFAHRDWFHLSYFAIMLNLFHVHKAPNDQIMNEIFTRIASRSASK
eukprot:403345550